MSLRGKSRLAVNLLLALFSAAAFMGVLELGARAVRLKTPLYLGPAPFNCLQRGTLLDVEFRPSCKGTTFGTHIQTNSLGLRGQEVRDDGSTRILTIGDSCTWGYHVLQPESYPAQLQRQLDVNVGAGKYQVLNAGIPGSTSYHGLLYLRERGLKLQPSIVIAGYGFNDMTTDGDVETQFARAKLFFPLVLIDDFFLQRSTVYRWARLSTATQVRRLDQPPRVPADRYKRNFEEMARLAQRAGARMVILDLTHGAAVQEYPRGLAEVAGEFNLPLVIYDGPRLDLVHPTVGGYAMLGEQIFTVLRENRYLH